MLEWMNKYIGTDWATYLGVLLGVASIVLGGKKILRNKSLKQSANASGGTIIQVGGNFHIKGKNESKSKSK
jgi:hypothetical protein